MAFRYFFDWNVLLHQPEDVQIIDVAFRCFFEWNALLHQPEDVQIVDMEFRPFLSGMPCSISLKTCRSST